MSGSILRSLEEGGRAMILERPQAKDRRDGDHGRSRACLSHLERFPLGMTGGAVRVRFRTVRACGRATPANSPLAAFSERGAVA